MDLLFAGESKHVLDDKKRLSIPARYRQWCDPDSECEFVITKVRGNYLIAYPYPEWEAVAKELMKLSQMKQKNRNFVRAFSRRSTKLKCDKQGRLLLPHDALHHAQIEKEITVIGHLNTLELWAPQILEQHDRAEEEPDEDFKNTVGDIF